MEFGKKVLSITVVVALVVISVESSPHFKGMEITRKTHLNSVTISWKQGSFFGRGGQMSANYDVYVYGFSNGANVMVFVQDSMSISHSVVIDEQFQYGYQNGDLFLVLHDKSRKPFQHRFVENQNALTGWFRYANNQLKDNDQYDLSWIAGDYLRNI